MFGRIIKPRLFPASVRTVEGTKWGYIDEKGKFVLKPTFEDAGEFQHNGLAIVRKGGAGVITQTSKFVVRPMYSSILPFTEGRAIAMLNEGGSVVLNEKGKVLTQRPYSFISPYQGGRAVFQDSKNGGTTLYGYLDLNGNVAIPAHYQYAFDMSEGKALVQVKDGLYALLDSTGTQLQTYPYEQMSGLSEGLISFKRTYQDKAGYVDVAGNIVIKPQFGMALPFQGGRAVVNASYDYKNRYGLIDTTGNYIIPPRFNDINQLGGNRAAIGRAINPEEPFVGSTYAIADTVSGQIMTDFQYDAVNNYKGEYSSVTQGLKSFFINKSGRQAKDLPVIEGVGTLSIEGQLVKAFVDQRLSYYDKSGDLVYAQNLVIPVNRNVSIREEKYRPNKDYLVYYPQLQGMKNKEAEKKVNEVLRTQSQIIPIPPVKQLDYNYTGDFSVQFYKKNLLILELNGYNYPFGAAHGMPTQIMVPIDIDSGKIYVLKDLFKPNSDYVKVLSGLVGKQIQEKPDNYFPDAFKGIQPDQPFYVSSDSLFLYFAPYEIAPYAAGFPTFEIPFKQIASIIDKKGAFWRSFH